MRSISKKCNNLVVNIKDEKMLPTIIIVNKVIVDGKKELSAQPHRIRLDDIKDYREWRKTDAEMVAFKEDITILYMKNTDSKASAIKILESVKNFDKRMGLVVQLSAEQVK